MYFIKNPLFNKEECRYCLENGSIIEPLYNMCNCKGSIAWYHKNCLKDSWRYKPQKGRYNCEICTKPFKGYFIQQKNYRSTYNPLNKSGIYYV